MCPRAGATAALPVGEGSSQPCPAGGTPRTLPGTVLPLTVLAWLGTGCALAGLNRWVLAARGFRYPLLLSALHMGCAGAVGYPLGWARGPLHPHPGSHARGPTSPHPCPPSPHPRARILLLSITLCASVALGNLGLSLVPLDVAQAVATTTPLITLVLSGLLGARQQRPLCPLQLAAMGPVCAAAACTVAGDIHCHLPGCAILLAATILRALKSIQQSVLLQEAQLDARALLCLTSLPSFLLLFGAAVALELGTSWEGVLRYDGTLWACVLLSCLGSVLYNLATFCILSLTSALTIHVLGNLTVVGNLLLSHLLFGSHLSGLGYLGIALMLAGTFMYHQPDLILACWARRGHPRRD